MARDEESRKEAQYMNEFPDATPDTLVVPRMSIALCRRRLIQYIKKQRLKIHEKDIVEGDGTRTSGGVVADEKKLYTCYMPLSLSSSTNRMIMALKRSFTRQRTAWTSHAST